MVESVDTKDLKSFGYCSCAGSSPASGTKQHSSPAPHRSIRSCVRPNFVIVGAKQHSPAPRRPYCCCRLCSCSKRKIRTLQHHAGRKCCCRLCSCSKLKIRILQHHIDRSHSYLRLAPYTKQRISIFTMVLFAVE